MSTPYWMVPIKIDALHLRRDTAVPGPMADFSKLPWSDGTRDYNSGKAYTSEHLLSKPFEDKALNLKAGIHLHWALPDTLTRLTIDPNGNTDYPLVPDYWLINRSGGDLPEQEWIVESSYLYPENAYVPEGAVTIPQQHGPNEIPYRYLGRNMPLESWIQDPSTSYMNELTAIGYGEPGFAAFYPNCHSVFGFYDGDVRGHEIDGLTYTVVGYYRNPDSDFYGNFVSDYRRINQQASNSDIVSAVSSKLKWSTTDQIPVSLPENMICYGLVDIAPDQSENYNLQSLADAAKLSVGNTGMEALSAYLAQQISAANKNLIEDQLEAVQFGEALSSQQLDLGAKFLETRHNNGFRAEASGITWSIEAGVMNMTQADAPASQTASEIPLPPQAGEWLNRINILQQQYDSFQFRIAGLQEQLFADWYKYQSALNPSVEQNNLYPDTNFIQWYLSSQRMPELAALMKATGRLELNYDSNGAIYGAHSPDATSSIAGKLALAINALIEEAAILTSQNQGIYFLLKGHGSPRYWSPNDPVLLITGAIAEATDRHGQDHTYSVNGTLPCHIATIDGIMKQGGDGNITINPDLLSIINAWWPDHSVATPGFSIWKAQPWNPFMLEWMVELQPLAYKSNIGNPDGNYSTDFITNNFDLPVRSPDLVPGVTAGNSAGRFYYSGRSLLTTGQGDFLAGKILETLNEEVLPDYFASLGINPIDHFLESETNTATVKSWYEATYFNSGTTESQKAADPDYSLLCAWSLLFNTDYLSQSLDGFTIGLLQKKTTMQLAVQDPLGFEADLLFANEMADAIGTNTSHAPMPMNDFSPLRTGKLVFRSVRLIDTFGQFQPLSTSQLITSEPLRVPETNSNKANMPPRLAQPARINLRWLSATTSLTEMNDLPATNPICGWVLPNLIDRSLDFYNSDGGALGLIDRNCNWQGAPGSEDAIYYLPNIENQFLRQVINWLLDQGESFIGYYIDALENGLENVMPENFGQHGSLSLLMGQPLAIIRCSVQLQLKGNPAVDQSWLSFRQDINGKRRDTAQFEYVKFPIRLGEYEQLNDGLIGYWIENGDGYQDNLFYAPQTEVQENEQIITHSESEFTLDLSFSDPAVTLTMIFDPRGKLHATSGILPVKEINIPSGQYLDALNKIEVTYQTSPLLTDADVNFIPYPNVPGYNWSWLERSRFDWIETPSPLLPRTDAVFSSRQRLAEGWLKLKPQTESASPENNPEPPPEESGNDNEMTAIAGPLMS